MHWISNKLNSNVKSNIIEVPHRLRTCKNDFVLVKSFFYILECIRRLNPSQITFGQKQDTQTQYPLGLRQRTCITTSIKTQNVMILYCNATIIQNNELRSNHICDISYFWDSTMSLNKVNIMLLYSSSIQKEQTFLRNLLYFLASFEDDSKGRRKEIACNETSKWFFIKCLG